MSLHFPEISLAAMDVGLHVVEQNKTKQNKTKQNKTLDSELDLESWFQLFYIRDFRKVTVLNRNFFICAMEIPT